MNFERRYLVKELLMVSKLTHTSTH